MSDVLTPNLELSTGILAAENTLLCLSSSEALKHVSTSSFPTLRNLLPLSQETRGRQKHVGSVSRIIQKCCGREDSEMKLYIYRLLPSLAHHLVEHQ